ncbi:hypothetical protein QNH14_05600 [Apirhabdus apintestini]|nr:hypothetical protein QNH14_05600 [Enterobacteriaceae bacterium CA-0114]
MVNTTTFLSKLARRCVLMGGIYGLWAAKMTSFSPWKNWHRPGSGRKVINELD